MTEIDDSDLLHRRAYDPQRAHEYYIRTRHLRGRAEGQVKRSSGSRSRAPKKTTTHKPGSATAAAASQRAALEGRLEHLRSVLADLVDAAKKRAGADTPTKKKSDTKKTDTKKQPEKKSKLTEAEKKEKARKERERYKKHPDKKKSPPTPHDTIPEIQAKIADIKRQIQQAIENNRHKSKTA